jgi:hypothetical protein
MMDLQKIGKFISDLRKEKGLTQEQLGEALQTKRFLDGRQVPIYRRLIFLCH